jgi:hypothetical protein
VVLVMAFLIASFATFIVFQLISSGTHHYLENAVQVIAFLFSFAGIDILKRAGYKKFPMRYIICSGIFTFALIFLLFLPLPKQIRHIVLEFGPYLFNALIAGLFPLSLYLKYKENKSSTETTVADAS